MTFEYILKRMLERVPDKFDKREGSIIYDASAPASFELAEAYIMARVILRQMFIHTADREFLIEHGKPYSVNIYPATPTIAEGEFSMAISIGTRFNAGEVNFEVIELIDDVKHTYKLECETAGEIGNYAVGDIIPIQPISTLQYARITKIITPGEDEEDTEVFRTRLEEYLRSDSYGGNRSDYKERMMAIPGVGGIKTYRAWKGGGTVKVTFVTSQYKAPDAEFIKSVQTLMDPEVNQGDGEGIAPIDHVVTVAGATETPIDVSAEISVSVGHSSDYKEAIKSAVEVYLSEQRKEWTTQSEKEGITVRAAFILAAILNIKNVTDVVNITINGQEDRITLNPDEVPVMGSVTV